MNDKDLRVIKTKQHIENALLELLKHKPIDKISVVELARTAKINKSTFYLHYQDINDLYRQTILEKLEEPVRDADFFPEFFLDPDHFITQLGNVMVPSVHYVIDITHKNEDLQCFHDLITILCRKIYETGMIGKNAENDMKLQAVFAALLYIMPRHIDKHRDEAHSQIATIIRSLFPNMQK